MASMSIGSFVRELALKGYRRKLKNKDFSLITNNCIGGYISHDMKLQFKSPTVNLAIDDEYFLIFCENLLEYSHLQLKEVHDSGYPYPVGILSGSAGDVIVRFIHYDTFGNAASKWEERCRRIVFEKVCVIMEGRTCTQELLERFDRLPFEHKVVLTVGEVKGIESSFPIPSSFYKDNYWNGKIMEYPKMGIHRHFEIFDYVCFLNSGKITSRWK